jgi:hypothetical protein
MLEVINDSPTVADAASEIAKEYDQELGKIEHDIVQLCRDLLDRDLLEIDGQSQA